MTRYSLAVVDPPWKWQQWTQGGGERQDVLRDHGAGTA